MADPTPQPTLPKTYSPAETEPRISVRWDKAQAFHAEPGPVLSGERRAYCILIPPPNVTAPLHLGHALNNSLQDILVRAHRMMGYETLWMPGTDHAGIATQAVIERRLRQEGKLKGPLKQGMTREGFVEQVQAWKDEYEATITQQLKLMGCSCDWARQRFTMDEQCSAAVREAFFRLFKDGLIYRGKRLVNWDPALQTAVADDECYDEEIETSFYYLRYPLVHPVTNPTDSHDAEPVTWSELAVRGYPGAGTHPPDGEAWVTVATTRPETYFGDTAVGVNPHDPRAKALRGLMVELPLVGRIIPIIEDDYVVLPASMQEDPEAAAADPKAQYATGFLKVTPAHDPNDFELYQRHKDVLDKHAPGGNALVNVLAPDATISDKHGWTDVADAHLFLGLSRDEARKKVVAEFYARGLLEETKPYRHSIKHSDRSKAIIEPYLSDQWYVKVTDDRMRGSALRAMVPTQRTSDTFEPADAPGDGSLRFYPARYAKTYEAWHENIRDWCISRQLWWGHRIPVWHKRVHLTEENWTRELVDSGLDHVIERASTPVAAWTDQREGIAVSVIRVRDGQVHDLHEDPLMPVVPSTEGDYDLFVCYLTDNGGRNLARFGFSQDPDVLDTWFSSALWPLSTLGWPDPGADPKFQGLLDAFNPSSVLCTAREIITLWVSRMVMFNRYFLSPDQPSPSHPLTPSPSHSPCPGRLPFKHVFIHAMIQDGEGRKMSKTLGNGVDPRDIIESHGADAMRFVLCHMTTQTQDVRMPVAPDPRTGKNTSPKFDIGRNFCNKLWNAARYSLSILSSSSTQSSVLSPQSFSLADRWMLSRLASSVTEINAALSHYEFSSYAQSLYDLLWRDFCDWYLEAIKPTVSEAPAQRAVLAHALETIVRLLHPITPFITEAIWEHLRHVETAPIDGITLGVSRKGGLLCTAGWPEIAPSLRDEVAEHDFERTRTLITAIREVRAKHNLPPKRKVTLHAPESLLASRRKTGGLDYVTALAGLDTISTEATPKSASAAAFRFESFDLALANLVDAERAGGGGDTGAERDRITNRIAEVESVIATLRKRLDSPGYAAKAPKHLVDQTRAELAKLDDELRALKDRLQSLD